MPRIRDWSESFNLHALVQTRYYATFRASRKITKQLSALYIADCFVKTKRVTFCAYFQAFLNFHHEFVYVNV